MKPKVSSVKRDAFINKKKRQYAAFIVERRTQLGMSQAKLAELCGVDRKTINRIENGHFSPSLDTMLRIALVLSSDANTFIKFA